MMAACTFPRDGVAPRATAPDGSNDADATEPVVSGDECYYEDEEIEGHWGDCATEQDIEDALIELAAYEDEHYEYEQELYEYDLMLQEWCNQNGCDEQLEQISGPSAECSNPSGGNGGRLGTSPADHWICCRAIPGRTACYIP